MISRDSSAITFIYLQNKEYCLNWDSRQEFPKPSENQKILKGNESFYIVFVAVIIK